MITVSENVIWYLYDELEDLDDINDWYEYRGELIDAIMGEVIESYVGL